MKRKLLICSSLITLLLSVFSVPIFAEETVQDSSNLHSLSDGVLLDQYFYDNYDLLPYLESDGSQYIDTGIKGSSDIDMILKFSDFSLDDSSNSAYLFGSYNQDQTFGAFIRKENGNLYIYLLNTLQSSGILLDPYIINEVSILGNYGYLNDNLIVSRDSDYQIDNNTYLFSRNHYNNPLTNASSFKLYSFKIYDHSLNDGQGAYIRYYYPAKSKSSGVIGLYDAVNKTFVSTSSSSPFENPTNEYVEIFQISSFLSASLGWIGQIFTAIIDMPIIIVFMAIGLAGAMFRWGRRIVHF